MRRLLCFPASRSIAALLALVPGLAPAVYGQPAASEPSATGAAGPTASASVTLAPRPEGPCAGGAVRDDGSVETGYGFVPSATMGQVVQRVGAGELSGSTLETVCVCWLRTRADAEIEFEVVLYEDSGGRPAREPYAAIAATAKEVPKGVEAAGRFFEVDVSGVAFRGPASHVGVRWNPSRDPFFFVCADTSPETGRTDVFLQEDRAPTWVHVKDSPDPIFRPHRAVSVRVAARP